MSERYWVTGVQLGMLKTVPKDMRGRMVDDIEDKQFIGNFPDDKAKAEFAKRMSEWE